MSAGEKLEEMEWEFSLELSDINYLVYKRDGETLTIDLDKKKITLLDNDSDYSTMSFILLNTILELIKEIAIG